MMTKLTKVHNSGNKLSIEFNVAYSIVDGPYSSPCKSYVAFLGRSKVIILIVNWKEAPKDVKESILWY